VTAFAGVVEDRLAAEDERHHRQAWSWPRLRWRLYLPISSVPVLRYRHRRGGS
jgi:hypothetical protein